MSEQLKLKLKLTYHTRVTAAEAAEIFNLQPWKIWAACRNGTLKAERFSNGRLLFKVADIEAALTASKGGQQ